MSRPPKPVIIESDETIYTVNSYETVRAAEAREPLAMDNVDHGLFHNHYSDSRRSHGSHLADHTNINNQRESRISSGASIPRGGGDSEHDRAEHTSDDYLLERDERSFFGAMAHCLCHPWRGLCEWCTDFNDTLNFTKKRLGGLSGQQYFVFVSFLVLLTGTQLMAVFGFNFWLHSFTKGNPTFTSIVLPSFIFAAMNFIMIPIFFYNQRKGESLLFWSDSKESIIMLIAVGVADSVAGMTSTYAVPHIPIILQTSITSCGAILVYILHRFWYKETALPFSFLLLMCFLFLLGSVACSVAPIYIDGDTSTHLEGKWIGLFMLVVIAPAVYNVIQGRFLGKYAKRPDVPPDTAKFVVLTGDFWVQLLVSFAYFPLDYASGFGTSKDADDAWEKAKLALECVRDCENNWIYLLLYAAGFWCGRVLRTILNMYSPTMGTFVMQLMGPIKAFAMVIVPSLNLRGKQNNVAYTGGTFAALLVATGFYLLASEQQKMRVARRKLLEDDGDNERGNMSTNSQIIGQDATSYGHSTYAEEYATAKIGQASPYL